MNVHGRPPRRWPRRRPDPDVLADQVLLPVLGQALVRGPTRRPAGRRRPRRRRARRPTARRRPPRPKPVSMSSGTGVVAGERPPSAVHRLRGGRLLLWARRCSKLSARSRCFLDRGALRSGLAGRSSGGEYDWVRSPGSHSRLSAEGGVEVDRGAPGVVAVPRVRLVDRLNSRWASSSGALSNHDLAVLQKPSDRGRPWPRGPGRASDVPGEHSDGGTGQHRPHPPRRCWSRWSGRADRWRGGLGCPQRSCAGMSVGALGLGTPPARSPWFEGMATAPGAAGRPGPALPSAGALTWASMTGRRRPGLRAQAGRCWPGLARRAEPGHGTPSWPGARRAPGPAPERVWSPAVPAGRRVVRRRRPVVA
jgi:hypothetical protein